MVLIGSNGWLVLLCLAVVGGFVFWLVKPARPTAKKSAAPVPEPESSIQSPAPQKGQPNASQALVTAQWRDALNESPHLLIYGPSKAGKSTLAQAYVATFGGCEYVVIDPQPNKPGEAKWGGIDFVTADTGEGDEWASVKAALDAVQNEDTRRRKAMRDEVFSPLIVIIDEVLALVDALGTVEGADGRKKPLIADFIARMGYSARHRNIKIILIGQGKNLKDLGLDSATPRNNYALVRAARNTATNERAAYIVTDDGEVPMNLEHVLELEAAVNRRAHLWLTQSELEQERIIEYGATKPADRQTDRQTMPETPQKGVFLGSLSDCSDEEVKREIIAWLLERDITQERIRRLVKGDTNKLNDLVREALEELV